MNGQNWLEVIDRDGWQKKYPLEKSIAYIGSHPRSDIILEGGRGRGIAPLHAQLIASHDQAGYQLVNLADEVILLGSSGDQTLPPRSSINIIDGTSFRMGDFILIFHGNGGGQSGVTSQGGSRYIGLSVVMPHTRLAPHQSLDGMITVRNLGERTGVKFDLELEGLDDDCYDLEPGPLLSSGAEKEVIFRLYHRGAKPLAGDWRIAIRATAPKGYPGEQALITQVIQVLPFYRHRLSLISPTGSRTSASPPEDFPAPPFKKQPLSPEEQEAPNRSAPVSPPVTPVPSTPGSGSADDWWAAPAEVEPRRLAVTSAAPVKPAPQAESSSPPPTEAQSKRQAGPPPPIRTERPTQARQDSTQTLGHERPETSPIAPALPKSETRPAKVTVTPSPALTEQSEMKPATSLPAQVEQQPSPPVKSEPDLSAETKLAEQVITSSPAQVEQQPPLSVEAEPLLPVETELAEPAEVKVPAAGLPTQVEQQLPPAAEAEPLLPVEAEQEAIAPADTPSPRQRWWRSWWQRLPFYRRKSPADTAPQDEPDLSAPEEAGPASVTGSLPPEMEMPVPPSETVLLPPAETEVESKVEVDLSTPAEEEVVTESPGQPEEQSLLPAEAHSLPFTPTEQTLPAEPEVMPQAEAGLSAPTAAEPAISSPQPPAEYPSVSDETEAWWAETPPTQTDLPESTSTSAGEKQGRPLAGEDLTRSDQAEWDISTLERLQPASKRQATIRAQTEDWWTETAPTEVAPSPPAEQSSVTSIQADQADSEQTQEKEAASATKDEWGAAENEPVTPARQRRVLRLKTTPLPQVEPEPAQPAPQKPAEDWWTE